MSHHHRTSDEPRRTGLRKHAKWLVPVGVTLMLVAMVLYVLSDDESLRPGQNPQAPVPASAP